MIERDSQTVLPEGLAEMPPGPRLSAVLALIDRSRLCGFDLVVLLQARNRQLAYEQAEMAADLVAVTACVEIETSALSGVCSSDIDKYAAMEVAAALTWTRRAASARLVDAHWLVERLPAVWAALRAGLIDLPKARVLVEGTHGLDEALARTVVAKVLPHAPELTTGQLAYRLRKLVLETDPQAAKKRYEEGVAERKVVRGTNPDGTGYLSGCNLPVDQAAAADERLDALARAAKQAGDRRPIDHIRADIYLSLLEGTFTGPGPTHRRGVVELTADLPTLIGLADHPGELAGWGPVIADITRQIAEQCAAEEGNDGAQGHTTDTAHTAHSASTAHSADTVHTTDTAHTAGTARPTRSVQAAPPTVWRYIITDPFTGGLRFHGTTRPPDLPRRERDPRRFPTKRQREFVIARDRTCRGPGCRVPARRTEIDHRIPHADGGPTEVSNLDAQCTTCHDLKDGGWTVTRNAYNDTLWESLLGHHYRVPATPITPPRQLSIVEQHLHKAARKRM